MNEIWVDAIIHSDMYEVSNFGNVRNKLNGAIKSKSKINSGYESVVFSKYRTPRNYLVHRLVWESFNKRKLTRSDQINHINKEKHDNRLENLEMVNQSQNIRHFKHGKKRGVQWTPHGWMAMFSYEGSRIFLGRYKEKEDAYNAFKNKYFQLYGTDPW
jgi:HNH endonuclease